MSLSDASLSSVADAVSVPSVPVLTILVADDSRIDRRIAASILEGRGHRVVVAADGTAALAAFSEGERSGTLFDAAVIDFQMPGLGGEELALALREEGKARDGVRRRPLRIVLLSGAADGQAAWKGIDVALLKPLDPTSLTEAIETEGRANAAAPAPAPATPPEKPTLLAAVSGEQHELGRVVFDLGEALSRARGKRALLIELVKIFMEDSETYIVTLRKAVAEGNLEVVEKAAHRIKGSSANVSAQLASDAAATIEKTIRATPVLPDAALFDTLYEEVTKARKALAGFLAQNQV
ncbi:DNA-binding response regulator, OmpR family, contains REC and winged-helix (wHTH) domain [Verrucomicrobium sp. GAS474]|uniref:Hpt domain-containing response regulator n=1 Tax=Verrucomicrobium sp. GAS474 TaxID=1882831 RepID=UPI00087A9E3B|nr:response regulator [Verrucomicrobium sp. GAS474]SDT99573.1 DNA-binding response regulator, OmpR family, contains REC and winged-helix (wHTH) domain [Verrucomicrobium sp. GAS474]